MTRKQPPPPIEKEWMTASMLATERGGHVYVWQGLLEDLRDELIAYYRKSGAPADVAARIVDVHFVGERLKGGRRMLAASPKAVEKLPNFRWLDTENEKTAGDLKRVYGGSDRKWNERIETLRDKLIGDITATDASSEKPFSATEVEDFVDDRFAGMRRRKGTLASLAVTKAGERYLPTYPMIEDGWTTGSRLEKDKGGSARVWNRAIEAFYSQQIRLRVDENKFTKAEAEEDVSSNMAGMRRMPEGGPPTWAICTDYLKELDKYYSPSRAKSRRPDSTPKR